VPGWRWGSVQLQGGEGKRATGRSWAFRMVWLLVTAVITRLGAFFESSRDLETAEEMLAGRKVLIQVGEKNHLLP